MLFSCSVVMYGCESWTIKKAECRRIDAFELWYWRRLLRVPWITGRSNQSILKEISPGFIGRTDVEAETLILWLPDGKSWLIWKDPDAGKDWGREEKGTTEDEMAGWHHRLNGHGFRWTLGIGAGRTGVLRFMELQRVGHDWATELRLRLSHSVVSYSLRPHGLQHVRLSCPSPSPGAFSNSTSIESVMSPNHLILCCFLSLLPSIFPSIKVFSGESVLCISWSKYWSFSFSISPSNEYSELISFRMDWFDFFAVQGTLKSLLQHHSSKASILQHSAFFMVQLSHPYMTTWKNHSFD